MKPIPVFGALAAALAFAAPASAAPITSVFGGDVTCTTQASGAATGQRWCQGGPAVPQVAPYQSTNPTVTHSFDGTRIDVSVALPPAPASGEDGNFPVVGVFHGYGAPKFALSDANNVQRWVAQGYAVFTMTDRGFFGSCGALVPQAPPKTGDCANGYIHLMSNAFEVRDAQYLFGQLADESVIDAGKIGVTGGSYGGGLSMQLAALNNRIQNADGSYAPWTSTGGKAMHIAAAAPEYAWSDLISSLMPNGSTLDYAAENPYAGSGGDRRFGSQKQYWNTALYGGGAQAGYYAPTSGAGFPDTSADITDWKAFNDTGGPYDGQALATQQTSEFPMHGAANTDSSVAPAPMLISNGWNDDLFPVDEGVRMYNRVRDLHPTTPIQLYDINYGHSNRSGDPASFAVANVLGVWGAETAWFAKYVKGDASANVTNPLGGVTIAESACANGTNATGALHQAANWASLAAGEIRVDGAAAQTVAPGTAPSNAFQPYVGQGNPPAPAITVCTESASTDTGGAAVYSTAPAPASGFTIAGASTVIADLGVQGANDQLIGRLLDVDPSAGTEKLIGRSVYRPTGVGSTTKQVFQLHPQAWKVAAGHVVKLELLSSDAPYVRNATGQQAITVSNLELRIPTLDKPGSGDGLVAAPAAKVLPAGYTLARDVTTPEVIAPTTPATPAATTPAATTPATTPIVKDDPLTLAAVRSALGKKPTSIKLSSSRKTVSFTDAIPEAGRITYKLSIDVKKGKKTHRYTLGTVTKTIRAAGKTKVSITISKSRRSLLKLKGSTRVVLSTKFVTGVLGEQVSVTRKFSVKR